jgi:hypothetical protein
MSIFGLAKARLHDARRAQAVATMDQGHVVGEAGEEGRLLDGRVASTNHRDPVPAKEEPVAGRARGHAVPEEPVLVGAAEHERVGPGRDDQRVDQVGGLGLAGIPDPDAERGALGELGAGHLAGQQLRAEPLGLRPHGRHELGTHHAVGEAGVVLHLGGQHELTARLVARRGRLTLYDDRGELRARRVDRRREARGPGSRDQYLCSGRHPPTTPLA